MIRTRLAAAVALVALTAGTARAQSATIQVNATVQTPITVTGVSNLNFGQVLPGVVTAVAPATVGGAGTAGGGVFSIAGVASKQVSVTVTVPTTLPSTTGGSSASLPIGTFTYCASTGNTNSQSSCSASSALFTSATNFTLGAGGYLWLYLGATVSPASNQAAESYQANVSLTAAYTGV